MTRARDPKQLCKTSAGRKLALLSLPSQDDSVVTCVQDEPRWPKMGPRCVQDGPRWPKIEPRWSQDGPRWSQDSPRWSQDGPRWSQDGPRWSQDGPRWRPDEPRRKKKAEQKEVYTPQLPIIQLRWLHIK